MTANSIHTYKPTVCPVDSTELMYNPETKKFSAEASELGGVPDIIRVRSTRTGREVEFTREYTEKDEEGAARWWSYSPTETCGIVELVLFND